MVIEGGLVAGDGWGPEPGGSGGERGARTSARPDRGGLGLQRLLGLGNFPFFANTVVGSPACFAKPISATIG